jgi:hypothetical protein
MDSKQIVVTRAAANRLRALLASRINSLRDQGHLEELNLELERAQVLETAEAPPDVVTMGSV